MLEKRHSDTCESAIFLFAHQDDETGAFQLISNELRAGLDVHCYYLTSGSLTGLVSHQRNQESLRVLVDLGVKNSNIHFVGSEYSIPDCALIMRLNFIFDFISALIVNSKHPLKLYLPCWEGGHPDHDALHVAGVLAANHHNLLEKTYQTALYNGHRCIGPLFRVLLPLKENGVIYKSKIRLLDRLRYLRYCLSYPSQFKTWIGLFPFFFFHYMFYGYQTWQPVSLERIYKRQHAGPLYFVKRRFCDEETFFRAIKVFVDSIQAKKFDQ